MLHRFGSYARLFPLVIFIGWLGMSVVNYTKNWPTNSLPKPAYSKEYTIQPNDTSEYTIQLAYDADNKPMYYYRHVFTPVCYTDKCDPVFINFYWDLLGNYLTYDMPPGKILTRVDHMEFEKEDYEKMHKILGNSQSILADYAITDLVDSKRYALADSVDAVTGATLKTIQNDVISGAVYSCYTLWHLVNGGVPEALKNITRSQCNDALLHQFMADSNYNYHYFALDQVLEDGQLEQEFLPDVLQMIQGENIFTARYAIRELPASVLAEKTLQTKLWKTYQNSQYALQMDILKKFKGIQLNDALILEISQNLGNTNEEQFSQWLAILSNQNDLPDEAMQNIAKFMEEPNTVYAQKAYETLENMPVKSGIIKKQLKTYLHNSEK